MGVLPGVADIVILSVGGRCHFIELKSKKGRMSDAQIEFQNSVKALGFQYHLCRSLLDVELALGDFGLGTKARIAA